MSFKSYFKLQSLCCYMLGCLVVCFLHWISQLQWWALHRSLKSLKVLFQIFSVLEQHMMMLWIERQEDIMEKNIKMIWYSGKYLCFNLVKCLVFWTLILFSFIHFQRRQHFLQCSVTTLINIRLKLTCHLKN